MSKKQLVRIVLEFETKHIDYFSLINDILPVIKDLSHEWKIVSINFFDVQEEEQ